MHHLSGVFLKEENSFDYYNHKLYSFSLALPKKQRVYYVDNEKEYSKWIHFIKLATGYSDVFEKYELKEKLGIGRFGIVRTGYHKASGNKIAIKTIDKTKMSIKELGLVMAEIEILKICHHPNIIKLYDVYENLNHIYIIIQHCQGGDLFYYLEKRKFKITEKRAQNIIYKLCTAINYLHSIGIIHRDLKPENIMMVEESDDSDIKLVDFGLSLILGPGQYCKEGVGTIVILFNLVLLCPRNFN
jgi:serine/threonine protein kinase